MARFGTQTILATLRKSFAASVGVIFTTAWWRNLGYREIDGPTRPAPHGKTDYGSMS